MAKRLVRNKVDRTYWTEGEGLVKVKEWVKEGLYDQQIAKNIGITQKTLIEWKKKYEVFNTVLDTGRGIGLVEVVNALFKAAKGYYYQEQILDSKGNKRVVRKYAQPNVGAAVYLSKNWGKNEYKDRWDDSINVNVKNVNNYEELTTEELRKLAKLDETE